MKDNDLSSLARDIGALHKRLVKLAKPAKSAVIPKNTARSRAGKPTQKRRIPPQLKPYLYKKK